MTITETETAQPKPQPSKKPGTSNRAPREPGSATNPESRTDQEQHIPIGSLTPNPANPRTELGDLTAMVRSIKTHGILQPLLVLPPDQDGNHLIVAGHRRHAAAHQAGLATVPIVIRDLAKTEVLEVMLIENGNREDLNLSEEIRTLEALMALNNDYTPKRLCSRIGKSQRWIKDRLAVTILPTRWRDALDSGELTLAAAVAAATLADLGPQHINTICEQLASSRHWRDPATEVDLYRKDLQTRKDADAVISNLTANGLTVYTTDSPVPDHARNLRIMGFDTDQARAHVRELCHAVEVRPGYNAGPQLTPYCSNPKRHRPTKTRPAESDIIASPPPGRSQTEATQQASRRKGRVARLAAGTELFARASKKPRVNDLADIAMSTLIATAGEGPKKHALKILDINPDNDTQSATNLLTEAAAESRQALIRVAGAVACGVAEEHAYHSESAMVTSYMAFLIRNGWEPDETTANTLQQKG